MARKKSPNASLVKSLKPPKAIPFDAELMQAMAEADHRAWQNLETLRREVYRHIMPNVWVELLDAERAGDSEGMKAIEMRADRQWVDAMGVPAITSWESLDIIMAAVSAAGYPATDAGLYAWTIERKQKNEVRETIPAGYRTRAMSKRKAANYLRGGNPDSAVEWLNKCIQDGTISCETLSRQSHVFDVRQFPESIRRSISPG